MLKTTINVRQTTFVFVNVRMQRMQKVTINVDGVKREGIIYTYVREYKVWHVVLTANRDDETPNVYVALSQLADENKVLFQEKLKLDISTTKKESIQHKYLSKDIDLNFVKLQQEIDVLKYDTSMRETQEVIDCVIHARAAKPKTSPITRHDPEPKTWSKAMNSHAAEICCCLWQMHVIFMLIWWMYVRRFLMRHLRKKYI